MPAKKPPPPPRQPGQNRPQTKEEAIRALFVKHPEEAAKMLREILKNK